MYRELHPSSPLGVDSADTSQLPKEKNLHGKFQYFHITQPGSSIVTPKKKDLHGQFQYLHIAQPGSSSTAPKEKNLYGQFQYFHSVPDPDQPDPHVFAPPGYGSESRSPRYGSGSGSFYHQLKIVRKALIPTVL